MRQGVLAALVGVGAGMFAALVLARLPRSLLFGVATTDAATFLTVPAALLASWLPARRAARVDLTTVLRE